MNLEYETLTEKIIGAAIEVHKKSGPGFLESINKNHGLILNFSKMPLEIKRVIYE
ncbi:MAG: GxxExxY protein [bacterium]